MGFEKFGRKSFTGATKVAKFVDFLSEGKIMGTVCKKCGTRYFPPRADCANCLSSEYEWFELPKEGILETYTVAYYAPYGFEMDCPYGMGVVDFGSNLKLFARISKDIKNDELRSGLKVTVKPVKYEDGQIAFEIAKV